MIDTTDKSLLYFLETVLNKNKKDIDEEDLLNIRVLHLNSYFIDGSKNKIDFSKLLLFKNLEEVTISNTILSLDDIEYIKKSNIKRLNLEKSTFNNDTNLIANNLEKLRLYNCYIDNYDDLLSNATNLTNLQIINPYDENEIDIDNLSTSLEALMLENCIIKNVNSFKKLKKCKLLSLLDTYLWGVDLKFLKEMPNLKQLYISDDYKTSNELFDLKNKINIDYDLRGLTFDQEQVPKSRIK